MIHLTLNVKDYEGNEHKLNLTKAESDLISITTERKGRVYGIKALLEIGRNEKQVKIPLKEAMHLIETLWLAEIDRYEMYYQFGSSIRKMVAKVITALLGINVEISDANKKYYDALYTMCNIIFSKQSGWEFIERDEIKENACSFGDAVNFFHKL